ncbi:peptide/nickel transport system permease protein [Rhizobium leguminosarum]|uniref:ABC transporter permease n=1 Tax=Rhizobium TaxID=379 RepID=UPI00161D781A|nr:MULTISPECIES: ABC transporter permease [Rhizobium]MBB4299422.1 peptide/nickel transport system permease protein [Rhizobium leguminosarum]MBB4436427.1 peptide/nickel transport system permease protein [Rhizobium esperanzae]MBB5683741.1 peptide/nickel transport system permease protein [Rhizobium leguminosarum]MBB6267707.1 peptide/nickel transport system permease protein [Rhizobium leguminosarum]
MSQIWILRRLFTVAYTLLVVSLIVFAITQVLPADAAVTLLGENATPEALAAVRERLGLNEPVVMQYLSWLGGMLHGNFGTSLRTGLPVAPTMMEALGRSLYLGSLSLILMLIIAIPIGILAAYKRGRAPDVVSSLFSYVGVSLPEFVTATLVVLFFASKLQLLPATGYVSPFDDFGASLVHLALPVLTVSLILVAHVSRMVRSETIDVLHSDYIRAARLKGLTPSTVLFRHTLPNALLPTITIVALDVGYLLGGIIVVEEIFAIPGIGRQVIVAITSRDLPSIQAAAIIMAATYAIVNTLSDIAYAVVDKRIRYD